MAVISGTWEVEEPKTLEDAFDIVEAFVQNRMGTAEGEEPVGLVCDTDLVGSTSSSYSVDPVFDKFGSSPRKWINQNGEIVYGSVTEETRNALSYLHERSGGERQMRSVFWTLVDAEQSVDGYL